MWQLLHHGPQYELQALRELWGSCSEKHCTQMATYVLQVLQEGPRRELASMRDMWQNQHPELRPCHHHRMFQLPQGKKVDVRPLFHFVEFIPIKSVDSPASPCGSSSSGTVATEGVLTETLILPRLDRRLCFLHPWASTGCILCPQASTRGGVSILLYSL